MSVQMSTENPVIRNRDSDRVAAPGVTTDGLAIGPHIHGVSVADVDGCLAIHAAPDQSVVILNRTASDIWRLCTGEHDLETLGCLLESRYGMQAGELADQVARAVSRLAELNLITRPTSGTP